MTTDRVETIHKQERERLDQMVEDLRQVEFLLDSEDLEFVAFVAARKHIHWPTGWGEKIEEIHRRYYAG